MILNTGSVAGLVSWGGSVYGSTKGAVHQLTRAVAIEGAPFDIRCNAICPAGMPYTKFTAAMGMEVSEEQQEQMALFKREGVNPVAGCLPMVIQIPVFFALYKVIFITIEMRHAPFFGWIKDLAAPDPTNIFNLFGLIPWDPTLLRLVGPFLHMGAWPLIMGVTMWLQMKLNPPPPDPTQQMIFEWMPVIFTFMLASFPAGLVIYWAWNNTLSVAQQSVIMRKHGAKIELFDNIKSMFVKKKAS